MIRFLFFIFILFNYIFATPIKVELQWKHQFEFAGFYAALEQGYYKNAGLDVELLERDMSVPIGEKCLNNEVQFFISYSNVILDIQNKKPYLLVANYLKRSPLALAVKKDILIPEDLKNKTIIASREEIQSANFRKMFLEHRIKNNDYNLIQSSMEIEDFSLNKVDAMTIYITNEPFLLRKKNIPFVIMDPSHYGGNLLYDVNLATTKNYAKEHPNTVKKFVDATNRGWKYALSHKEGIVDLILEKYNTQHKSKEHLLFEANEIEKLMEPDGYEIGSIDLNRIKKIEELYIRLGDTKEYIEPKEFVWKQKNDDNKKIILTQKEKDFIKKHPNITFGIDSKWAPYIIVGKDGELSGYEIDMLEKIKSLTGLNINMKVGRWSDMLTEAKAHKIDGVTASAYHKEREKDFIFSTPYIKIKYMIAVSPGNPYNIKHIEDLKNLTIVTQKDNLVENKIAKSLSNKKPIFSDEILEAYNIVARDEAQATITSEELWYHIYKNDYRNILPAFTLSEAIALRYSIRKDWAELKSILDKAIKAIPESEKDALKTKWLLIKKSSKNTLFENFTQKEQKWLKSHNTIRLCADPLWAPMDYINDKGEQLGMGAEFMKIFSERIGQKIELIPTKSWQEVLDKVKARKCDIVSLVAATPSRKKYLDFTTPYFSSQNVIATREDVTYIEDVGKLKDEVFGVVRGFAAVELLKKKYPKIKLKELNSVEEGLRQVEEKKIFGFIDIVPTIAWNIKKLGMINLKISGDIGIPLDFNVGVHNDIPELKSIFQKAVDSLSGAEKESILSHYINVRYEQGFDYSLFYKVILVSVILFVFVFYYLIQKEKLNKELRLRVKEEVEKSREKDNMIFHQNKLISMGEMIENIAHQWRQPLSQINASVMIIDDELKDRTIVSTTIENELNDIEKTTKYMSQTIDDFKSLFSVERKIEAFKVKDIVDESLAIIGSTLKNYNISVEKIFLSEAKIYHNKNKLIQVLMVLLNNSKDALFLNNKENPKITIKVSEENESVNISVCDNGGGIKQIDIQKIFEPYFTTKHKSHGTGLGLYISKIIIEQRMDGILNVSNKVDGVCFEIKLSKFNDG